MMVADAAELISLRLTLPELVASPVVFRQPDGTSVFRPKSSTVFTSESQLAAEDRLLERAANLGGPTVLLATVEKIMRSPDADGRMLGDDQVDALARIAVSGRMLDVLVGPAGAGKTTAMNALRRAWEAERGTGSVVGLAPAQILADDLGSRLRRRRSGGRTTSSTAPRSRRASSSSSTKPPSRAPCH
ncbi:hypothetical protein KEM60_02568 [Austwickia sp. TVS 96-490-7B]|nr:hypothetical protein [Austwickia sp. TVS 96-490-7B]